MRLHQDGLKGKDLLGPRSALARRQLHLHARLGHVPCPDARPQLEIKLAGNDADLHGDVVLLVEGEGLFEPLLEPILLDAFLTVFHPPRHVADQVCNDELDGEDEMFLRRMGRSRVSLRLWRDHDKRHSARYRDNHEPQHIDAAPVIPASARLDIQVPPLLGLRGGLAGSVVVAARRHVREGFGVQMREV